MLLVFIKNYTGGLGAYPVAEYPRCEAFAAHQMSDSKHAVSVRAALCSLQGSRVGNPRRRLGLQLTPIVILLLIGHGCLQKADSVHGIADVPTAVGQMDVVPSTPPNTLNK